MDDVLKDLSVTLLIGGFVILGLEAILYFLYRRSLTGFFQGRVGFQTRSITAVFVAASFGLGLLAEDVSYKFVDTKDVPVVGPFDAVVSLLPLSLQTGTDLHPMGTRKALRLSQIVENTASCVHPHVLRNRDLLKPTPLAIELSHTGAFSAAQPYMKEEVKALESWLGGVGAQPSIDSIEKAADRLYYFAKNRVFTQDTYYHEMSRIQTRQDFSRSVALIALCLCVLALGSLPFVAWRLLRRKRRNEYKRALKHGLLVPLMFFIVYIAGLWAYHRETDEFNKRAFGYYSGMRLACVEYREGCPRSAKAE